MTVEDGVKSKSRPRRKKIRFLKKSIHHPLTINTIYRLRRAMRFAVASKTRVVAGEIFHSHQFLQVDRRLLPALSHLLHPRKLRQSHISTACQQFSSATIRDKPNGHGNNEEIPQHLAAIVEHYVQHHQPSRISLGTLIRKSQAVLEQGQGQRRREGQPSTTTTTTASAQTGLISLAQLLHHELPIRLSHRIQELHTIPELRDMPSVLKTKRIYLDSLEALLSFQDARIPTESELELESLLSNTPTTPLLERKFAKLLQDLYSKHSSVLLLMAQGAYEYKQKQQQQNFRLKNLKTLDSSDSYQDENIQECLHRFYTSRAGIRVLAGQYLAVRNQWVHRNSKSQSGSGVFSTHTSTAAIPSVAAAGIVPQYLGMICSDTSPYQIVQQAIADATHLCQVQCGIAPAVVVRGDLDLTFPYIPTHLHYILLELLKNAFRATVERHQNANKDFDLSHTSSLSSLSTLSKSAAGAALDSSTSTMMNISLPEVVVIIADHTDNEDVVIKIADQGGGIPRSQVAQSWSYLYTTASSTVQSNALDQNNGTAERQNGPVLAGLGYGLPMSRTYARYFGGDVDLISLEGYGCDAFVHLKRLGDEASSFPV